MFVEIAEGLILCSKRRLETAHLPNRADRQTKVMACPLPRLGHNLDIQGSTTGHSRDIWDIEAPVYAVPPISTVSASSAM